MTTSSRLLELLGLLQNHRSWSGEDLAAQLGVSMRTMRRAVEELRDLGYLVHTVRGLGGGYRLAPGGSLPPLVVDDEEAVAIVLGLQSAAMSGVAGVENASLRALTKIVQVLPERLRRRADTLRTAIVIPSGLDRDTPPIDLDVLTSVAQACRDSEIVTFRYRNRDGDMADRDVEPHRLVKLARRWYVVAYDRRRHDWRSFRLDRIVDLKRSSKPFVPRRLPSSDAAAFVHRSLTNLPKRHEIAVVVHAPAETVRAAVAQWGRVESLGPQSSRLRMSVDTLDWVAMMLGSIGAPFDVDESPELVAVLRDWGTRFSDAADAHSLRGAEQ